MKKPRTLSDEELLAKFDLKHLSKEKRDRIEARDQPRQRPSTNCVWISDPQTQ